MTLSEKQLAHKGYPVSPGCILRPPPPSLNSTPRSHLGGGEVTEMLRRKSLKENRLRMQLWASKYIEYESLDT